MFARVLTFTAALLPFALFSIAQAQPVVRVLDHGEAPYQELRYSYAEGQKAQATMSMNMQMSMGGQAMPAGTMPAIETSMSVEVTDVFPDGSARIEQGTNGVSIMGGVEAGSTVNQMLQSSLDQVSQLTSWARVDSRGQTLDAGFDLPEGINPMVSQMMDSMGGQMQQLSAPFPAEPVGVGARWETSTTLQLAGAVVPQTSQYELLSRDGDTITLSVTFTQHLDAQNMPAASIPPEAQAALEDTRNSGSGTMTINLNSIVPEMESTTTTSMSGAAAAGQDMSMVMTMSVSLD